MWASYFFRVGGVFAVFVVAILVTREFFPGKEGYVVIAISTIGISALAMKGHWGKKRVVKNGVRGKKP